MMCDKLRQEFMEAVLSGPETVSAEAQEHLRTCAACAFELASFQRTMGLLDEWQAPEPSPYFSSRLRARMREQAPAPGWLAWLRRPVMATAAMALVAAGVGLLQIGHLRSDHNTLATNSDLVLRNVSNSPSPAVSDLQYLDKNADLFADFDALDGGESSDQ